MKQYRIISDVNICLAFTGVEDIMSFVSAPAPCPPKQSHPGSQVSFLTSLVNTRNDLRMYMGSHWSTAGGKECSISYSAHRQFPGDYVSHYQVDGSVFGKSGKETG